MSKIKNIIKRLLGFFVYFSPYKKSAVIIFSTMRSGSTLLKELLQSAEDTTNNSELNPLKFGKNIYEFNFNLFNNFDKKIVIFKKPFFYDLQEDAFCSKMCLDRTSKYIVLIRTPSETIQSLLAMNKRSEKDLEFSQEELLSYWCRCYEIVLHILEKNKLRFTFVWYHDLVANPKEVTQELFHFIGSEMEEGVDSYSKPKDYQWKWGDDDGGDVIKSLKVQKFDREISPELLSLIENSTRVKQLVDKISNLNSNQEFSLCVG